MKYRYKAYNLTEESRQLLLEKFPPLYENVVLHHITYKFGFSQNFDLPPEVSSVKVVGYTKNEHIECLVVALDGSTLRPDGLIYHITISHDNLSQPKDSNALLESGFDSSSPIYIKVVPALNK